MKFLLIVLAVFGISTATLNAETTTQFSAADSQMNDAIDAAKATMPLFMKYAIDKKGEGHYDASLKVAFHLENSTVTKEYIWVGPFSTDGNGNFKGFLGNQPVHLTNLNIGDEVSFTADQIIDWSIWMKDGKSYGGYTTRVILETMKPEQAAPIQDMMSNPVVPTNWN